MAGNTTKLDPRLDLDGDIYIEEKLVEPAKVKGLMEVRGGL